MATLLICAAFASRAGAASSETLALFDGHDLEGWVPVRYEQDITTETLWIAEDGVLRFLATGTGYLRTPDVYENYVLRLEWRWPEKAGNSGVMLHVQAPDKVWPAGFEAQLFRRRAGDFLLSGAADCAEKLEKRLEKGGENHIPFLEKPSEKVSGEWNAYEIRCVADTIELRVNGVLQNKITHCRPARGMIALKAENSPIEFRNITLEKLNP